MGVGREKLTAKVGASMDRVQSWPETFLNADRPVVVKKRRRVSMEQAELWPSESVAAEPVVESMPESVSADTVSFVDVAKMREPAVVETRSLRRGAHRKSDSSRQPTPRRTEVRVNNIARYLNVNGAIEGMKTGGIRFDLPGRGYPQALRLWTGTTEDQTYSSARF